MNLTKWLVPIIFVISASAVAQSPDSARPAIWSVRTPDSIPLTPAAPMVGRYPIPPVYFRWMKELAECEGLKLPPIDEFAKSEFIEVNSSDFQINDEKVATYRAVTVAQSTGQQMTFFSIGHVFDEEIVKHELLHGLLLYNFPDGRYTGRGKIQHPAQYYGKFPYGTCNVRLSQFDK